MVGLLVLAHERGCEAALAQHLQALLEAGELPHVEVRLGSLVDYDALMDRPAVGGVA